jgi:Leucine-rich repeat (LRR) protein
MTNLTQLLKQKYPSASTKKIELDEQFFLAAKQFSNEVLDFSYYPNLEQIISQAKGEIKKIDVSRNRNLKELIFPNNQLTSLDLSKNTRLEKIDISNNKIAGKLDIGNCPNLKVIICKNNYLTSLRAHINLFNNNTLITQKDNLCPQKDRFGEIVANKIH